MNWNSTWSKVGEHSNGSNKAFIYRQKTKIMTVIIINISQYCKFLVLKEAYKLSLNSTLTASEELKLFIWCWEHWGLKCVNLINYLDLWSHQLSNRAWTPGIYQLSFSLRLYQVWMMILQKASTFKYAYILSNSQWERISKTFGRIDYFAWWYR